MYNKAELIEKLKNIELLCLDVDGTLTDGGMYLDSNLALIKKFFAHDGLGITLIRHLGVKVAIVSTSNTPILEERGKQLKLDAVIMGSMEKGEAIQSLQKKFNIKAENTAFMGDDINDILGFKVVGLPIAVANCTAGILEFVCYVTEKSGGAGAVREICDNIMLAKTGKLYGEPYVKTFIQ